MVPISASLADICRQYKKYKNLLPHNRNFFFVKMNGCRCLRRNYHVQLTKTIFILVYPINTQAKNKGALGQQVGKDAFW